MRIACIATLCLLAGCFADRLAAPAEPLTLVTPAHVHVDEVRPIRSPYVLVLDGVIYRVPQDSSRFEELNPADIQYVEIIKGPATSALYHTTGCSAVLIVTTKHHDHAPQ